MINTAKAFTILPARYAKGKIAVQVHDSRDGYKGRASNLAEVVGGRWTNREKAYIMSLAQGDKFYALYHAGFDAYALKPGVVQHDDDRDMRDIPVAQAYKLAADALFASKLVEIDQTLPIAQGATIVAKVDIRFKVNGKGRTVVIRQGDKLWVTNAVHDQNRSGFVKADREGRGVISHGWGFPISALNLFKVEPGKQPVEQAPALAVAA